MPTIGLETTSGSGEIFYQIVYGLFIWLFISICFFLFRYFRHIRQERQRFLTLEPDFQDLDQRYRPMSDSHNAGLFGRIVRLFDNLQSDHVLNLNLQTALENYQICDSCGALSLKEEITCEICGSSHFIREPLQSHQKD